MAEFGMKATELSAPQGAGANVVAPTTANPLEGIGMLIEGGASLFSAIKKSDDDKIISEYSKKLSMIEQSDLDPFKKGLAQRKLFSEYNLKGEGRPAILEKLAKATKFHRDSGALGDSEEAIKTEAEVHKDRIKRAASEGVFVDPKMPMETQVEILRAHDATLRNRQAFDDMVKRHNEERTQKGFLNSEEDRAQQDEVARALSMAGATQSDAILAQVIGTVQLVSNGSMPWEVAQQNLTKLFADTDQVINSLAGKHPQLVAGYRSMFNDMRATAFNLVDPNKKAETSESALKDYVNRAKLLVLQSSDRRVLASHISQSLLPQTITQLTLSEAVPRAIFTFFGANDPTKPNPDTQSSVPVGSKDEQQVVKLTTTALEEAFSAPAGEKADKAKETASNALNNLLLNTRQIFADPLGADNPKKLNNVAQMIASPVFAKAVAEGRVKPDALMTAAEVMQTQYQQPIFDTIHNKLASKAGAIRLKVDGKAGYDSPAYKDVLDIKYGAGGVEFAPKPFDQVTKAKTAGPLSALDAERGYAAAVRSAQLDMREIKTAIDTLVKQQAHLEGHYDYAKTFEKMRPQILEGKRVETTKAAQPASNTDYSKESNLAAEFTATDSGAGMTRDVIDSLMRDLPKMTPAQRKEFQDALKRLNQ